MGWSYKSRDPYGKGRRKRRRRASNLADDLTREGIEAYFEAKQRELEVPGAGRPGTGSPSRRARDGRAGRTVLCGFRSRRVRPRPGVRVGDGVRPSEGAHPPLTRGGQALHGRALRELVEARNHPDEQLAKLREDVDAARREFHASRRRSTPCNTHARGFWPACTCSPRRGATPRTPCPA